MFCLFSYFNSVWLPSVNGSKEMLECCSSCLVVFGRLRPSNAALMRGVVSSLSQFVTIDGVT